MFGFGILVGLGRRLLAGPVARAGLLPAGYYRHLALAAMEAEDFSRTLEYLQWAEDPLLVQILVFRLRLLKSRHQRKRQNLQLLLTQPSLRTSQEKLRALADQEDRALELLGNYEARALNIMNAKAGKALG